MALLARLQQAKLEASCDLRRQCSQLASAIAAEFGEECLKAARRGLDQCMYPPPVEEDYVPSRVGTLKLGTPEVRWQLFVEALQRELRCALGDHATFFIFACGKWHEYWGGKAPGDCSCPVFFSATFSEPEAPLATQVRSNLLHSCAICLETLPVVALVPCGHLVCAECCGKLQKQSCPVCRGAIAGHQNLFGS